MKLNLLLLLFIFFSKFSFAAEKNVDPNLIGGLKIQIGSQMIDSSIKNQLQLLKEKMKEVA